MHREIRDTLVRGLFLMYSELLVPSQQTMIFTFGILTVRARPRSVETLPAHLLLVVVRK